MLLDWVILFKELTDKDRNRRRDPLADPLARPEWQGLGWFNALFEKRPGDERKHERRPIGAKGDFAAGQRPGKEDVPAPHAAMPRPLQA